MYRWKRGDYTTFYDCQPQISQEENEWREYLWKTGCVRISQNQIKNNLEKMQQELDHYIKTRKR